MFNGGGGHPPYARGGVGGGGGESAYRMLGGKGMLGKGSIGGAVSAMAGTHSPITPFNPLGKDSSDDSQRRISPVRDKPGDMRYVDFLARGARIESRPGGPKRASQTTLGIAGPALFFFLTAK